MNRTSQVAVAKAGARTSQKARRREACGKECQLVLSSVLPSTVRQVVLGVAKCSTHANDALAFTVWPTARTVHPGSHLSRTGTSQTRVQLHRVRLRARAGRVQGLRAQAWAVTQHSLQAKSRCVRCQLPWWIWASEICRKEGRASQALQAWIRRLVSRRIKQLPRWDPPLQNLQSQKFWLP